MKVAVVGYAGSGKSTFARRPGDALCIPVQHLDQVFYTSNWQERDKGEARDLAEAFLDVNDAWVVDGTYHRLALARRLEAADVIVIFAFPRRTCLAQAWRRSRRYAHRVRPDMADGCIERLDAEFVLWLVWKGRTRSHRKRFEEIRRDYAKKTVVVRSRDEVERLFAASPHRRLRTEAAKRAGLPWSFPWHFGLSAACPAAQMLQSAIGRRRTRAVARNGRRRQSKGRTWHSSTSGRASSPTGKSARTSTSWTLAAPHIAASIEPGQFVHMKVPSMEAHILRRPFSVYARDAAAGTLEILYQAVGFGTDAYDAHRARAASTSRRRRARRPGRAARGSRPRTRAARSSWAAAWARPRCSCCASSWSAPACAPTSCWARRPQAALTCRARYEAPARRAAALRHRRRQLRPRGLLHLARGRGARRGAEARASRTTTWPCAGRSPS